MSEEYTGETDAQKVVSNFRYMSATGDLRPLGWTLKTFAKVMTGKSLCRIGLHKWKHIGFVAGNIGHIHYECERPGCDKCKQEREGYGWLTRKVRSKSRGGRG